MIQQILVYLFVLNAFIAALCVITSKNPVHSILHLVFVFLNVSALLLILNVDFLAMIFLIVYVGAIAILFLFIVMLLNIKSIELSVNLIRYLPIGLLIGLVFYIQIYKILSHNISESPAELYINWIDHISSITNIESLGQLLYTKYFYLFILASVVLLVAMVSAIVLTMRHEVNVRRQDVLDQVTRKTTHIINYK